MTDTQTKTNEAGQPKMRALEAQLELRFPYFAKIIQKRIDDFGQPWAADFEDELSHFFANDDAALLKATDGYGAFALDAMKLQTKFNKTREYINKRYEDVAKAVYHSEEYMFDLYLPGILLSQFLWPHHYRQLKFFREKFVPRAAEMKAKLFFDVGVGTGFYSKEMLANVPGIRGRGYDISAHSLAHTKKMLERWNLIDRYEIRQENILSRKDDVLADCIISVEVLEHLEDPVEFLKGLHAMLRPGGIGYITAAVNAPNADHIYLYTGRDDVAKEIESAGFTILDSEEFFGYVPKPGESVPSGAVFIVSKQS